MTPKQKAIVLTQLLDLQKQAYEKLQFHQDEAQRYRIMYSNFGEQILKLTDKATRPLTFR